MCFCLDSFQDEVSLSRQTPVRGKRRREWEGRLKPKSNFLFFI